MKISVAQLQKLIREQVEEMADMGVPEARGGRGATRRGAAAELERELSPARRGLAAQIERELSASNIYEVTAYYTMESGRFVGYVRAPNEAAAQEKAYKLGLVERPEFPSVRKVRMSEVNKKRKELEADIKRAQEQLDAIMNIK